MPVKKRIAKGRAIDDEKILELIEGPGACLVAGLGYYMPHHGPGAVSGIDGGFWWELGPEAREVVLGRMQADWARYGAAIMATSQTEPWALREFGPPAARSRPLRPDGEE